MFLSNYAGLRPAYEFSQNRKAHRKFRQERQASECCRVLCLLLMLTFTMLWVNNTSDPAGAYWAASYYKNIIGGEAFTAINSEDSLYAWL